MVKVKKLLASNIIILILLFGFFISVWRIWENNIYFTDELLIEDGAYGFAKGEWLVNPRVNGNSDLAKPPLVYWASSLVYHFLPVGTFTRRITTVIFGMLLIFSVYKLTRLIYDKRVALWASILVCSNGLYLVFVKTANFDLPNALYATLAIYFYNKEKLNNKFFFTSIFISLGILTRSFLALVPLVVIIADTLFVVRKDVFRKIASLVLLVCLFTVPWHIAAYISSPAEFTNRYLKFSVIGHGFNVLAGDMVTTPFFYLKIFLLFPLGIFGLYYMLKNPTKKDGTFQLFLWFTLYFLILSLSKTRHEWYAVPLIVPLAITSAKQILSIYNILKGGVVGKLLFKAVVVAGLLLFPIYFLFNFPDELDVVKAARYMSTVSEKDDVLYLWKDAYFTGTRFFPGREVKVTNLENLPDVISRSGLVYIEVNKKYEQDFWQSKSPLIYDEGDFQLYLIKSTNAYSTLGFCVGPAGGN